MGTTGAMGPAVLAMFSFAPHRPSTMCMHAAVVTLQSSQLSLPDNHTARQGRPLGSY